MPNIIAHTDLPGNYRLIRLESSDISAKIQAGDYLFADNMILPYLRKKEPKLDCLFLLDEQNQNLQTGSELQNIEIKTFAIEDCSKDTFRIMSCRANNFAAALALALESNLNIDLFLFELIAASPFKLQPSQLYLPYMPAELIANLALLEEKKIAARFYSQQEIPGCFCGSLEELLAHVRQNLLPLEITHYFL